MNTPACDGPCPGQATHSEATGPSGQVSLRRRVGTRATFFEAMKRALSAGGSPALRHLSTREPDDPAIALLDAWATVADVLTFYQERIANECYLRTATERRSLVELARLVGYRPRPGVAASTYLAFTVEGDAPVEVPLGTRAQSLPDPGELPQSFETVEPLAARTEWNELRPQLTRPQPLPDAELATIAVLYLAGIATGLRPNDMLLITPPDPGATPIPRRVQFVTPQPEAGRTRVELVTPPRPSPAERAPSGKARRPSPLLTLPRRPAVIEQLPRRAPEGVLKNLELATALFPRLNPDVSPELRTALANSAEPPAHPTVEALRVRAARFGHNAPKEQKLVDGTMQEPQDCALSNADTKGWTFDLDAVYDRIVPGSRVLVVGAHGNPEQQLEQVAVVDAVATVSRADYGISGRVTELTLRPVAGQTLPGLSLTSFAQLRRFTIYAQAEALTPAEEPIDTPEHPQPVGGPTIALDGLYPPMEAGRLLIVAGERAEIGPTSGVPAAELVVVAGVTRDATPLDELGGAEPTSAGYPRTTLTLDPPLAFAYRPESVRIYANVVRATQGESCEEVLGDGDGGAGLQQFTLKRAPLTYVPAATADGALSTLQLYVDGARWEERPDLNTLGPADHAYVTQTDAEGKTTVTFGDGERGARPPTGVENVVARYRFGMGPGGNVRAGQISQLPARPAGVKAVINPLPASGGVGPDADELIRGNAPLGMRTFGRVVSRADYAAFARAFAGIGKAYAERLVVRGQELVHLTVAGLNDKPILHDADLSANLGLALQQCGDPFQAVVVEARELLLLVVSARVRPLPTYRWKELEPRIRARLLDRFSFERRDFGEPVLLSAVTAAIQGVRGVAYVDVELLSVLHAQAAERPADLMKALDELAAQARRLPDERIPVALTTVDPGGSIRPAQIAYLDPKLRDTLILQEIADGYQS